MCRYRTYGSKFFIRSQDRSKIGNQNSIFRKRYDKKVNREKGQKCNIFEFKFISIWNLRSKCNLKRTRIWLAFKFYILNSQCWKSTDSFWIPVLKNLLCVSLVWISLAADLFWILKNCFKSVSSWMPELLYRASFNYPIIWFKFL
jgi:hypothetical protein